MSSHQISAFKQIRRRSSMGPGCTVRRASSSVSLIEGGHKPAVNCKDDSSPDELAERRTLRRRGSLKNLLSLVAGAATVSNLSTGNTAYLVKSAEAFTPSVIGTQHSRRSSLTSQANSDSMINRHKDKVKCSSTLNAPDVASCFGNSSRGAFGRRSRSRSLPSFLANHSSNTSLNLVPDATVLSTVADPGAVGGLFSSSVMTAAGNAAASAASMIRPASGMETFLMTKVSHIVDMSSLINPESMMLKSMTFFERALDMASDIDPSQRENVSLDDVIYQGGMLAASGKQVLASIQKMMAGAPERFLKRHNNDQASSFRDCVAYHGLFSKAGMTYGEFHGLLSSGALSWIDVESNDTVQSDEDEGNGSSIYWLYNGEASIVPSDKSMSATFARKIMHRRRGKTMSHSTKRNSKSFSPELLADQNSLYNIMGLQDQSENQSYNPSRLLVGKNGATLLRINVENVRKVMKEDFDMDKKIRNLVYLSTRSKVEDIE